MLGCNWIVLDSREFACLFWGVASWSRGFFILIGAIILWVAFQMALIVALWIIVAAADGAFARLCSVITRFLHLSSSHINWLLTWITPVLPKLFAVITDRLDTLDVGERLLLLTGLVSHLLLCSWLRHQFALLHSYWWCRWGIQSNRRCLLFRPRWRCSLAVVARSMQVVWWEVAWFTDVVWWWVQSWSGAAIIGLYPLRHRHRVRIVNVHRSSSKMLWRMPSRKLRCAHLKVDADRLVLRGRALRWIHIGVGRRVETAWILVDAQSAMWSIGSLRWPVRVYGRISLHVWRRSIFYQFLRLIKYGDARSKRCWFWLLSNLDGRYVELKLFNFP